MASLRRHLWKRNSIFLKEKEINWFSRSIYDTTINFSKDFSCWNGNHLNKMFGPSAWPFINTRQAFLRTLKNCIRWNFFLKLTTQFSSSNNLDEKLLVADYKKNLTDQVVSYALWQFWNYKKFVKVMSFLFFFFFKR